MRGRRKLAQTALKEALRLRASAGLKPWQAICVYELASNLSIRVIFVDIPGMEGMYFETCPPQALICAHRPPGRQAFTCAHELAHHVFVHGHCLDVLTGEYLAAGGDPEEFAADCFAGYLLMPKVAVSRGFQTRGWDAGSCTAVQVYTVACWLGVGYSTLITHMRFSLGLLTRTQADLLLKQKLKDIRLTLLGQECDGALIVADYQWSDRPIDVSVGDLILLPEDTSFEGSCIELLDTSEDGALFRGCSPGIGRFSARSCEWAASARVSRNPYIGLSRYRHLEDPEHA